MGYGEVFFLIFFVVAPVDKSNTTLRCMPFVLFSFIEGIKFAAPHKIVIHQTEHTSKQN